SPYVDGKPLEQCSRFLDPRENAEAPVGLREALETDLRLDALGEALGFQDLDRALEVDIRHLARLDLGLGCRVEGALWLIRHAGGVLRPALTGADCPIVILASQSTEDRLW